MMDIDRLKKQVYVITLHGIILHGGRNGNETSFIFMFYLLVLQIQLELDWCNLRNEQ